jgi:hypothetical protein
MTDAKKIMMTRAQEVPMQTGLSLSDLSRMAQGKLNWRLEMEGSYDAASLYEVWESEETDSEQAQRLKREQRLSDQKAQQAAKKLQKERAQYEQLKQKFAS